MPKDFLNGLKVKVLDVGWNHRGNDVVQRDSSRSNELPRVGRCERGDELLLRRCDRDERGGVGMRWGGGGCT